MRVQERVSFGGDTPQSRTRLACPFAKARLTPCLCMRSSTLRVQSPRKDQSSGVARRPLSSDGQLCAHKTKGGSFQLPRWFPKIRSSPCSHKRMRQVARALRTSVGKRNAVKTARARSYAKVISVINSAAGRASGMRLVSLLQATSLSKRTLTDQTNRDRSSSIEK